MTYNPVVNHYVKWNSDIEGWVYFKCDDYITIELNVRPKDDINYKHSSIHRNERLLVICYNHQWNQLTYITERTSKHDS